MAKPGDIILHTTEGEQRWGWAIRRSEDGEVNLYSVVDNRGDFLACIATAGDEALITSLQECLGDWYATDIRREQYREKIKKMFGLNVSDKCLDFVRGKFAIMDFEKPEHVQKIELLARLDVYKDNDNI